MPFPCAGRDPALSREGGLELLEKARSRSLRTRDAELPVTVVVHPRATRLTLRIVPGGESLRLTTPPHVSDHAIGEFLERNRNWVETRVARLPDAVRVGDGVVIDFLGVGHRIEHVDRLRGIVEPAVIDGQPVLRVPGDKGAIGRKLRGFFIREARWRLNDAVAGYSEILGVRPRAIRITDTSSRWGSCSTTRTLSFSWRVVMAPAGVLDYLAAHETAHLREMNHSRRFWGLVRDVCPEMDRHKDWLKRNGQKLHVVRFD